MGWSSGAVFGVSWLIFFLPISITGTVWFWRRRDIQPIKARSPQLVVVTDVVLILYVLSLCLQRIIGESWPCTLTLWSGHIGTIILFNTYLWRCWTLFFTFNMTQARLQESNETTKTVTTSSSSAKLTSSTSSVSSSASSSAIAAASASSSNPLGGPHQGTAASNFFIKNKRYISGLFLVKVTGTLTVVLTLPCGLLSATNKTIPTLYGESCDRAWGDTVLAAYVAIYSVFFIWFAYRLRAVIEVFGIKSELKVTSGVGLVAVIPWLIFNSKGYKSINTNVFPFSTLFLIIAAVAAFVCSTLWPLYRSIWTSTAASVAEDTSLPSNLNTLQGLLSTPQGVEAFKRFLTKEFSVENILYFQEVEDFRRMKREAQARAAGPEVDLLLLGKAREIYAKYIIIDAPFQVNLPDPIVRKLERALKNAFSQAGRAVKDEEVKDEDDGSAAVAATPAAGASAATDSLGKRDVPTIFDPAQLNIFNLMNTDSFPRYVRTEEYKEFCLVAQRKGNETKVMREHGII